MRIVTLVIRTFIGIKDTLNRIIDRNGKNILTEGYKNMIDRFRASMFTYLVLFIAKNIEGYNKEAD